MEAKCLRCKRPLRNAKSAQLGYGETCFKKMKKSGQRQTQFPEFEKEDEEDVQTEEIIQDQQQSQAAQSTVE